MRVWLVLLLLLALLPGCTSEAPPPPPVPNAPEDLSTWAIPEMIQPPAPEPEPAKPVEEKPAPGEEVLQYQPGTTFTVRVPLNWPLDVVLEKGESVITLIGGDRTPVEQGQNTTPRIEVKDGQHGTGDTMQRHLFFTTTTPKLTAGFILTTNRRVYLIEVKTVATSTVRTVRWKYPVDPETVKPKVKRFGLLPDPETPKRYHVGYNMESKQKQPPEWLPKYILDDGRKMYIIFPEITLFETAPMVRMVSVNGPALVNSRTYLNVLIIDQLAPRLELRVGIGDHAETVVISRGNLTAIACPGSELCPVWPAAAMALAKKGAQP